MDKNKFFAIVFWLGAFLIFYLLIGSPPGLKLTDVRADTATTTVTITNATPTISSFLRGSVTLSEGVSVSATSTGTASDNNGCSDIQSITATFYDSSATSSSCGADNNNCYIASCATTTCSGTDSDFNCSTTVQYFANNSSGWRWYATVTDAAPSSGTSTTATTTIAQLNALDVTNAIAYGSLALGGTSATGATTTVTNTGNKNGMDAQVSAAAAMTCTSGTIAQANQHYATTTSGFTYGSGVALSDTPTAATLSIAQRTSATTTGNIYWKLQAPATSTAGTCTGVNTFTAN